MEKHLKILNVEDSEEDSALLKHYLEDDGYSLVWERVQTAVDLTTALAAKDWDIILCDYTMPRFSAVAALGVLRESNLDIPFIVISGTVSEETAVEALLTGANDYIPKGNLTRLVPAIQREVTQAKSRREKRQSDLERRRSDDRYRTLFEYAPDGIIVSSPDDYYLDANASMCRMLGYTHDELIGMHASDIVIRSEAKELDSEFELVKSNPAYNREWHFRRKDGSEFPAEVIATITPDGNLLAMIRDISERKAAVIATLVSELKYQSLVTLAPVGIYQSRPDGSFIAANHTLAKMLGYDAPDELVGINFADIYLNPNDRRELFEKYLDKGLATDIDLQWRRKDGLPIWIQLTAHVIKSPDGTIQYFEGFVRDISNQKLVEDSLRESDEKFHQLADHIDDAFWIRSPDMSEIHYISPAYEKIWGRTLKSDYANPHEWTDFIVPMDRQRVKEAYADLMKDAPNIEVEYRIVRLDGSIRWVRARGFQVRDSGGRLFRLAGIVADITESKNASEALSESEERYRSVVNTAPDVIVTIDDASNICFINPAAERIFGYSMDELKGAPLTILMPERLRQMHEAGFKRYLETGVKHLSWEYLEVTGLHKNGCEIPITISFSEYVQNDRRYFTGIIRDISERKQAMEALQESEERYRELVENALDIIYTHDFEGNYTSVNRAAETISGYTRAEVLALNMVDTIPADQVARAREMIEAKLAGEEITAYELDLIVKDGTTVPIEVNTRIIYENGIPVGVQGIARDITDRKLAVAELQEKSALLEAQLNSSIDGILVVNEQGKQIIQNGQLVDLFNIPQTIAEDTDDAKQVQWVTSLMKDPDKFVERVRYLYEHPDEISRDEIELKDGRVLDRYSAPVLGKDKKNYGRIWNFRDMTERKRSREALESSERSLRELAEQLESDRKRLVEAQTLAKVGSWHTDLETLKVIWSEETYRIFELDRDQELDHGTFLQRVHPDDRKAVGEAFKQSCERGSECEIVHRVSFDDGTVKFVEERWQIVRDDEGKPLRAIGSARDITERRLAEKEIESTMKRLNAAQRIGKIGDWAWDRSTGAITWSPEVFNLVGRDPALGPPSSYDEHKKYYEPRSMSLMEEKGALAIETGDTQEFEITVVRDDGIQIHAQAMCEPETDDTGEVCGLRGTIQDISARQKAEAALRESEARYHSLFENMIEGYAYCQTIFKKDKLVDWVYTEVNGAFERLTGLSDVVGRKISDIVSGAAKASPELFAKYERAALTGRTERFEIYLDPIKRWLSITVYSSNREHFVAVFDNITERKLAESALLELQMRTEKRERMLTSMLSSMTDMAQIYDPEGRVIFVNRPVLELWGRTLDEVVGKTFSDLGYGDALATKLLSQIDQVYRTKEPITDETPFTGASGNQGIYEYIFTPAIDAEGNVDFVVGSTRDVTERERAAERLRTSEANLAKSQEIAHLGSWELIVPVSDGIKDGSLRWSDEVFRIFGYEAKEIEVSHEFYLSAIHSEDRETVEAAVYKAVDTGEDFRSDHRIVRPDGIERYVHEHAEVIRDKELVVRMVGTIQDITDRKILEEQYRQSQKMEAVGVLAGGIAHDFNNLLTAINGFSDLTLRSMEADSPFRRNIQEVKNAGARAAELTGQLLAFSRKQVLKPSVISLNSVISNVEKMLRRIIRESVELRVVLDPKLGNVMADPGQIEQVIVNLSINARDAMPLGGNLTIETENIYLGEAYLNQHIMVAPGEFVRITVSDTGEGMDAETQSHIFEPFFTTKEVGKGTGLGLSTVYGIVKQSGGTIMVYSELGHGTTFKLYLPCVDAAIERPRWSDETEAVRLGIETILLVEDEDAVRSFVTEVLESSGYTVLAAANGPDALALCGNYSEPINLLVSDVIMPKMGGAELKKHVVEMRPEIKVLFISGYTDDSIAHRGIDDPNIAFLEKPFTPDALTRKVREVLDSFHKL